MAPVYSVNGVPSSSGKVGDILTYDVVGYSRIWLYQLQNGVVQYDGPFDLPMSPYTLLARDAGSFTGYAYALNPDNSKGTLIGSAAINVASSAGLGNPNPTPVSGCANGICGPSAPTSTVPTTPSGGGGGSPSPGSLGLPGTNPTPGNLGLQGGSSAAPPPTVSTPAPGTPQVTGFDLKMFAKGPYGLALGVLLLVIYLLSRRERG